MTSTNVDRLGQTKSATKAIIDVASRVADEDYFRAIKEHKTMATLQKRQNERTMARTRFDDNKEIPVGAKAQLTSDVQGGDAIDMVPASAF